MSSKSLTDILKGVKKSTIVPLETGTDPGVDYDPKYEGERKFIKKHSVEKTEDRMGNGDDLFKGKTKYVLDPSSKENRHGRGKGEDKKVYEAAEHPKMKEAIQDMDELWNDSHHARRKYGLGVKTSGTHEQTLNMVAAYHKIDPDKLHKAHMKATFPLHEDGPKLPPAPDETVMSPSSTGSEALDNKTKTQLKALANKIMDISIKIPDTAINDPHIKNLIDGANAIVSQIHDHVTFGSGDKE